jgi:hypothetical protein
VFHKGRCCGKPAKRSPFVIYIRERACMFQTACYTHEILVQAAFLTSVSTIYFTRFKWFSRSPEVTQLVYKQLRQATFIYLFVGPSFWVRHQNRNFRKTSCNTFSFKCLHTNWSAASINYVNCHG